MGSNVPVPKDDVEKSALVPFFNSITFRVMLAFSIVALLPVVSISPVMHVINSKYEHQIDNEVTKVPTGIAIYLKSIQETASMLSKQTTIKNSGTSLVSYVHLEAQPPKTKSVWIQNSMALKPG
ncbi:MAG: hypothetical protein CSA35_02480 [Dethiosulfovibrio peptidovorans]|nr:MAG: hypothetical protein CSA35_02480 [Dethiosulfovibrio peptidovorans]